jgi:hypothetical protein
MRSNCIDITGQKFRRLSVIGYAGPNSLWNVRCDCGTEKIMNGSSIRRTKSCGCLVREVFAKRNYIHGDSVRGKVTPEYHAWAGAIKRCEDQSNDNWIYYGGRGIQVCDLWRNSYPAFLENMGRKPSPKHSLDRIDNDGNYEPGNCRWATKTQQMRNRRDRRIITFFGRPMPASEAAELVGLKYDAFLFRLDRGWTEERALLTPLLPAFGGKGAERFSHTNEAGSLKRIAIAVRSFLILNDAERSIFEKGIDPFILAMTLKARS